MQSPEFSAHVLSFLYFRRHIVLYDISLFMRVWLNYFCCRNFLIMCKVYHERRTSFYSKYSILDMKFILIYYKLEILTCWASDESLPESFTTIVELKKAMKYIIE